MSSYTALLDLSGHTRVDMVLRDDGAFVLTGKVSWSDAIEDVADFADADGLAYQAWLKAGGKLGDPVVAPRVREAITYQLMSALTDVQRTAYANAKPWDQRLFSARDTPWPETNEKIGRIAAVLGTTPKAWFDAALGVT